MGASTHVEGGGERGASRMQNGDRRCATVVQLGLHRAARLPGDVHDAATQDRDRDAVAQVAAPLLPGL